MSSNYDDNQIENRLKTLMAINVLEPITKSNLTESLINIIDKENLSVILTELEGDGLISIEKGYYRVTRLGMSFNVSKRARNLRDINRMMHIINTSKQRGGKLAGR